jgi:hypothetical protein
MRWLIAPLTLACVLSLTLWYGVYVVVFAALATLR